MENKRVTLVIALILIVGIGFFLFKQKESSTELTTLPETNGITLSEVAQHYTRETCWVAINGSVYDLTSWIPNHPGGEAAILGLCGKDGTNAFTKKHGEDTRPQTVLAGFKIGKLIQ